jgi:hypothetical protein
MNNQEWPIVVICHVAFAPLLRPTAAPPVDAPRGPVSNRMETEPKVASPVPETIPPLSWEDFMRPSKSALPTAGPAGV